MESVSRKGKKENWEFIIKERNGAKVKKGLLTSPGQVLRAYKCFKFSFKIKGKSVGSLVSWRLLARTAREYRLPIFIWWLRIEGGGGGDDSGMVGPWFSLTWYKIVKSRLPREAVHMGFGPPARLLPCHPVVLLNMKLPFPSWAPTTRKLPRCNNWESLCLSEILPGFSGVRREDEKNFTWDCWVLQPQRMA